MKTQGAVFTYVNFGSVSELSNNLLQIWLLLSGGTDSYAISLLRLFRGLLETTFSAIQHTPVCQGNWSQRIFEVQMPRCACLLNEQTRNSNNNEVVCHRENVFLYGPSSYFYTLQGTLYRYKRFLLICFLFKDDLCVHHILVSKSTLCFIAVHTF